MGRNETSKEARRYGKFVSELFLEGNEQALSRWLGRPDSGGNRPIRILADQEQAVWETIATYGLIDPDKRMFTHRLERAVSFGLREIESKLAIAVSDPEQGINGTILRIVSDGVRSVIIDYEKATACQVVGRTVLDPLFFASMERAGLLRALGFKLSPDNQPLDEPAYNKNIWTQSQDDIVALVDSLYASPINRWVFLRVVERLKFEGERLDRPVEIYEGLFLQSPETVAAKYPPTPILR